MYRIDGDVRNGRFLGSISGMTADFVTYKTLETAKREMPGVLQDVAKATFGTSQQLTALHVWCGSEKIYEREVVNGRLGRVIFDAEERRRRLGGHNR